VEDALTENRPTIAQPPNIRDDACYVFHYPPKFLWREKLNQPYRWNDYDIYLHVPFCRAICTFCTFERTVASKGERNRMFDAILAEVDLRKNQDDFSGSTLKSIYMGGGTASLLANDQIAEFLGRVRPKTGDADEIECTLECEPGTKHREDFQELRNHGVNRVSIGIQSFDPDILRGLNRKHTVKASRQMVMDATAAGMPNVHIDLMYGLPGQTMKIWKATIEEAATLDVDHISVYRMIVFANELLFRKLANQEIAPLPTTDEIEEMRVYGVELLAKHGYRQYSLTEFAREGKECKYVKGNWIGTDYLGFGPAAYSRNGNQLWENTLFHHEYYDEIAANQMPIGRSYTMDARELLTRDIAMGLCMLDVDLTDVGAKSGQGIPSDIADIIQQLSSDGFLKQQGSKISLTSSGVRYATHVMKRFTT
jgi:oxygen-independent coproporphyrinogen-3 oxidase